MASGFFDRVLGRKAPVKRTAARRKAPVKRTTARRKAPVKRTAARRKYQRQDGWEVLMRPAAHKVVHLHVPTFRKQHKKVYYKSRAEDARLRSRLPGKRTSRRGKTYYEYRVNRADISKKARL